ncbi:MAG: type II secretion system F family protein, partial [Planctomycetales bacterium]|nr:type II secretion system F family protein [Planctomycetales bacterium]
NALFERIFSKVTEAIREGEVISKPLQEHAVPGFHPLALFFWMLMGSFPGVMILSVALTAGRGTGTKGAMEQLLAVGGVTCGVGAVMCALFYLMKMRARVIDTLVVNMVDVGEETGELDTMLYKVADTYDDEVNVMTEGLTRLIEPLLICFLGVAVGFIVISLFMPLVAMISSLA